MSEEVKYYQVGQKYRVVFERGAVSARAKRLFWERVLITDDHWLWLGYIRKDGHGQLTISPETFSAQQLSWIINRGHIPDGYIICHLCDKPSCVNPSHLYVGTPSTNLQDSWDRGERVMPCQVGSRNYYSKLSEDDVTQIKLSLTNAKHGTARKLAHLYNVHEATISYIRNNKTWTHVEVS